MNHKRYKELCDKGKKPTITVSEDTITFTVTRYDPDTSTPSSATHQVSYTELVETFKKVRREYLALVSMLADIDIERNKG